MDKDYAKYLLEKTHKDYNQIAEDFSKTREYISEEIKNLLLQYIMPGERVLDWGCGNGRFNEIFQNTDYYGVDVSEKMIKIAKNKYPNAKFKVVDPLKLPFPNNFFDKIFSLAVFHHIPSEKFRLQFLEEGKRVLKPNGIFIITVWNLNPLRMIFIGEWKRALLFIKYIFLKIFGKIKIDFKDFFIPWRDVCLRYIHCFSLSELKKLAQKSNLQIKKAGILKSQKTKETNIYIILKKL